MTDIPGHWPIALLMLASCSLHQPGASGGPPARDHLPIKYYSGETGLIEVPLDPGRLGWRPERLRRITTEPLEHPGEGDGPDGEDMPDNGRLRVTFMDRALKAECFDHWLYGELTEQGKRVWLLSVLSAKVVVARKMGLSAIEEERLILAGRGDIKRFFDRVEESRAEFEGVRRDFIEGQEFLQGPGVRSLSVEFREGPFGDGSLFARTLGKIENDRKGREGR